MMKLKHLTVGIVLALSFQSTCQLEARAATCLGDQCPPGDHNSLGDCYDGCDWALAGDYVFCDVVSPEYTSKMVCPAVARNKWSNCYRNCIS